MLWDQFRLIQPDDVDKVLMALSPTVGPLHSSLLAYYTWKRRSRLVVVGRGVSDILKEAVV